MGQSENAQGLSAPVKMPATSSDSEAERLEEEQSYVLRVVHSPTGVAHWVFGTWSFTSHGARANALRRLAHKL